jgi:SAM-dependent methyltransferase
MTENLRVRRRQGNAVVRNGVPYANAESTLSLIPGAAVGEFLAHHKHLIHGRLLDAGAGNQPYKEWYEPLVTDAISVDAAPIEGLDALALVDRLPFGEKTFDVVLATEVLEHVDDAEVACSELLRVLKPGGHVIVTVPYLYPTHEAPYDYRRFTHFGLQKLLERRGFDDVQVFAKGGGGTLVAHYVVLASTRAAQLAGRIGRAEGDSAEPQWVRKLIAWPQHAMLRKRQVSMPVTGTSTRISLGYMAVARRPP